MRMPLFGARTRSHSRSIRRDRAGSPFVAGVLAAALMLPSAAIASGPASTPTRGADTEAPTWGPEDEAATPPAEGSPPAEPAPTDTTPTTPAEPTAEPTPPAEPETQPKSAGPTAPSETTRTAPTTADSQSIGSKSPGGKAPDDEVTVLEGTPDRMRPMQKAGWWTLFGGFVFATVGGVFSGLAERQEDKAERIAVRFDENSAQPSYEDVQDEYEEILGRGRAFASTAIALGVVGGALAVAGITLLAVDEARLRKGKRERAGKGRRARLELRKGGLQVKF